VPNLFLMSLNHDGFSDPVKTLETLKEMHQSIQPAAVVRALTLVNTRTFTPGTVASIRSHNVWGLFCTQCALYS
jgi:hypothetical protein